MEPSRKSNRKWIIFGIIIAVLAILVAVGPILVTRYMRYKTIQNNEANTLRSELMIKVKGVIKQSSEDEKSLYLAGENGLFYVIFGDQSEELMKNIDKTATVFGKLYEPQQDEMVDGNPIRLRIEVINIGLPDLTSLQRN